MLGTSEVWLRTLSVIFGVFSVWILYIFSSKVFDKKIGLLSALFLALSPYHVYYSQEVRMYSEAVFFALLSMYFYYCSLKENNKRDLIGYSLSTAALIYTHYDGFFLIGAQIIYAAFSGKETLKKIWKYLLVVFLLWSPWIPQFLDQLKNGNNIDQYLPGWRNLLSLSLYKSIPLTLLKFSIGRISLSNSVYLVAFAVLILMFIFFLLFNALTKNKNKKVLLIFVWFITPIFSAVIFSFKIPLNQPFRLLYILPAFYLLLALGIKSLGKTRLISFLLIITVSFTGLLLYYLNPVNWREDWRGASRIVSESLSPDSLVLFAWPDPFPPFRWYAKDYRALGVVTTFPATRVEVKESLRSLDKKEDVFLFEYLQALSDPNKYIQQVLEEKGFKNDRIYNFNGVGFVDHYK